MGQSLQFRRSPQFSSHLNLCYVNFFKLLLDRNVFPNNNFVSVVAECLLPLASPKKFFEKLERPSWRVFREIQKNGISAKLRERHQFNQADF